MTKQEAEEIIAVLSKEFRVPKPTLTWTDRARRGRYFKHYGGRIVAGNKCWRTPEMVLLHEFAHHLTDIHSKPSPRIMYGVSQRRGNAKHHDAPFRYSLLRVAAAWFGDESQYAWHNEYKAIRKWKSELAGRG